MKSAGLQNIGSIESNELQCGDVISPHKNGESAVVLYRESDVHHSLFLTNRCNSYCLMCSQPPTPQDDSWLIAEAIDVISHIRNSPECIGLTGGEPLLLGKDLRRILDALFEQHPQTFVDVLTNARLLSRNQVQQELLTGLGGKVSWLVPLYGHADFLHDFIVQSVGAFEETVAGLLALQESKQAIQLRIVLIEPVLQVLPELCAFIGRNLPFVREVALMACEPTGFALANRNHCEVDLTEWKSTLEEGTQALQRHRVPCILMNAPLCALPRSLWPFAQRSISDWKNVYASECDGCGVRGKCSGLFAWHDRGWKPSRLMPIVEAA